MRLIETTHLKTWASSTPANSRLPYLVKELICAVIQPEKFRFPSGDAVWVPGADGTLVNDETNRFVPIGLSVWEVGTRADYKNKANEDYAKRSTDKSDDEKEGPVAQKLNRSKITFVFVTPLVWADKDDWVAERKKEEIWHDVIVIDGVDLQEWLEVAEAATLRFAAELGLVPEEGLQTLEHAWEEWSYRTTPPASEALVIVGREEQEKELISRLLAPASTFTVRGDSPREAWGFALAVLRRVASEEERLSLSARTIVADDEQVAGRLRHRKNLIIVLKQARGQVSGHLSSRGCHVIVPEGNDARSLQNVIVLGRTTHRMFAESLSHIGLLEEEADRAARACGLSVTILQRQRASANFERPAWVEGQTVMHLLPALLASRWNSHSEADRQILCRLAASTDYLSVESQLQGFLWVDEPPLQQIEEMWTLTAPVDAFELTARRLSLANLDRFKDAFREVFSRIDPKVELPPDEWLYHDMRGERGHSGWLRSGMAEILLLIAERGEDAGLRCVPSPRTYAEEVVRGLPGLHEDWRVLASLRDEYARLMEAAPRPFLDSLEHLIETKPDDICHLFVEGHSFGGGSLHTGLLWALETLAWSPDYLPRVTLILAKLARLDPGGRIMNRPVNSLREIFLWWHPGTNASLEQRLAAVDLILAREPKVGWELLATLLPHAVSSVSNPTAKPRWSNFGDLPENAYSRGSQLQYMAAIVDRALVHVGTHRERWQPLLDSLRVIGAAQRAKVVAQLTDIVRGEARADMKTVFWEMLRDFIYKHRTFSNAQWSLPDAVLDQLERILVRIAPDDPIEHHRWLFETWLPDIPSGEENLERRQQVVESLRHEAIQEILTKKGPQGVVSLGATCKFPGFVAHVAVPLIEKIDDVRGLIEQAVVAGQGGLILASHLSGRAQQLYGETWRRLVRQEAQAGVWSPIVTATLMLWWPNSRGTWEDITAMREEVGVEYWHRKQVGMIDGSAEDRTYQIDRLIEAGRAAEAFDRIALHGDGVPSDTMMRLFDAAIEELGKARSSEEIRRLGLNSYDVGRFLDQLRSRGNIPREALARREYMALPLLGSLDARGLTIHAFMAEDPDFFVAILCDIYRPAHQEPSLDTTPTAEEQARARAAYTLLEGMEQIPGQHEGHQIDEAVLRQWINRVRLKAAEVDRTAIADLKIGNILAHAPIDPEDGGWPHQVIRNVIEQLATDEIRQGVMTERYNMRGVSTKAVYEGGEQERTLASQYRIWGNISHVRWPRMTRILEDIAEGWEADARREDARAEQNKMTLC